MSKKKNKKIVFDQRHFALNKERVAKHWENPTLIIDRKKCVSRHERI